MTPRDCTHTAAHHGNCEIRVVDEVLAVLTVWRQVPRSRLLEALDDRCLARAVLSDDDRQRLVELDHLRVEGGVGPDALYLELLDRRHSPPPPPGTDEGANAATDGFRQGSGVPTERASFSRAAFSGSACKPTSRRGRETWAPEATGVKRREWRKCVHDFSAIHAGYDFFGFVLRAFIAVAYLPPPDTEVS